MVQNQNTGCYATDTVDVKGNIETSSLDLSAGTITCASPTIQLSATTNAINPTYKWTGPGVFSSSTSNPQISKEGVYTLQLTNANGCITTKSIRVEAQINVPSASALGGVLDCQIPSVQLKASSNQVVTYEWSGPNGFSSNEQNPSTSVAGLYTLVVTSANGCTNTSTAQVGESKASPSFTLEGGNLTCTQNSVQLSVLTTATIKSLSLIHI